MRWIHSNKVLYTHNEGRTTTLLYKKNIWVFSFFRKESNLCCVRERQTDGGRQRQTAILTHNFFFFSSVLSSRSHLVFLLLLSRGYSSGGHCEPLPQRVALSNCKTHTDSNWFWSTRGLLHVSFHNAHNFRSTTWLLPLIYTGASCSKKSLIDGSVKGQYATVIKYFIKIKQCRNFLHRFKW